MLNNAVTLDDLRIEPATPAISLQLNRLPGENTFTSRMVSPMMSMPARRICSLPQPCW